MRVSLIIPCFNEEENLPILFNKLQNLKNNKSIEIIIVENGSTDNSLSVLKSFKSNFSNIRLVAISQNKGYGYGIIKGLKEATGDLLAWTHADMQTDPTDILKGLKKFNKNGDKIFAKGLRYGRKPSDRIFTVFMSIFASLNLNCFLWDINAQPSIFPASFLNDWENPPFDFSLDLYAYFLAKRKGYKIKRFKVKFDKRKFGSSKWNINFESKIKFIKRNIRYIIKLSNDTSKWK
tara:strand:+ start:1819 stop:2523 length:705 start_codon:yes stop_codon:yes gene_type:complete